MNQITRRGLLKRSTTAGLALGLSRLTIGGEQSTRPQSPNDAVNVPSSGSDRRRPSGVWAAAATNSSAGSARSPASRSSRSATRTRGTSTAKSRRPETRGKGRRVSRPPRGFRRQERRRGGHRPAEPLARPGDGLGLPGGQGRLRREAVLVRPVGRTADGGGGPQVRPHGPGRHPEPVERVPPPGVRPPARRRARGHPLRPRAGVPGPRRHRDGRRAHAAAEHRGLRPLVRPGPQDAADAQAVALRVALVLGHGQRRDGEQRHPRHRRLPLGPGSGPDAPARHEHRRPVRLSTTAARRPTPTSRCWISSRPRSSARSAT